ncbi:heme exporter protein CcmD [Rhizobium leguminosarum]|uniref:heme exporter protein CcmD n=1 Tax=Rhizobium TaxID=379 RepID=UPI000362A911|nr:MULTISPECIES: heme exporter protein CcmD [Rhizobium]MBY5353231.1 heme exporter protein CcmD [Rhizobium leguminosarum]MBY5366125.1 heme exporter protein CcmD [Rhizobium leguminosarum]MBY5443357.1 heme exporter protein CcmD [Rhizobium leguminosarum]MBY5448746.1 heme exporter protein CcmD [Rhizobium leguminosarum]NDK50358.1 heme exporter protein CcmD [Rhizobium laguerreae]
MTHAFYVYASYGFAALVTIVVTVWTWADGRARRRELAALEAAGIRRRSARPNVGVGDGE